MNKLLAKIVPHDLLLRNNQGEIIGACPSVFDGSRAALAKQSPLVAGELPHDYTPYDPDCVHDRKHTFSNRSSR